MLGAILSTAAWNALHPRPSGPWEAPEIPPPPPANATAAEHTIYQETNKIGQAYWTNYHEIKTAMIAAIGPGISQGLTDPGKLTFRTRDIKWLMEKLRTRYGEQTFADAQILFLQLQQPFDRTIMPFENFVGQFQSTLAELASQKTVMPERFAVSLMEAAVTKLHRADFSHAWRTFMDQCTTVDTQTLDKLLPYLHTAEREVEVAKTSATEGYAAAITHYSTIPAPSVVPPVSQPMAASATPQQLTLSTQGLNYCYTHGYQTTHDGNSCNKPGKGHVKDAKGPTATGGSKNVNFHRRNNKI